MSLCLDFSQGLAPLKEIPCACSGILPLHSPGFSERELPLGSGKNLTYLVYKGAEGLINNMMWLLNYFFLGWEQATLLAVQCEERVFRFLGGFLACSFLNSRCFKREVLLHSSTKGEGSKAGWERRDNGDHAMPGRSGRIPGSILWKDASPGCEIMSPIVSSRPGEAAVIPPAALLTAIH